MNDGRHITAPVGISDVREVLGLASGSLAALGRSGRINPYSRYKPYAFGAADIHRTLAPASSRWALYCRTNNWGMEPRRLEWPDTGSVGEGAFADCAPLWGQPAPVCGECIRLGDFAGYDHGATAPALRAVLGMYFDPSQQPNSYVQQMLAGGNDLSALRPVAGTDTRLSGRFTWMLYLEGGDYSLDLSDFTEPESGKPFDQCYPTMVVANATEAYIVQDTHDLQTPHANPEWSESRPYEPQEIEGAHWASFNWAKVDPGPFIADGFFTVLAGLYPEHPNTNRVHSGDDLYFSVPLSEAPRPYSVLLWPDYAAQRDTVESQVISLPVTI